MERNPGMNFNHLPVTNLTYTMDPMSTLTHSMQTLSIADPGNTMYNCQYQFANFSNSMVDIVNTYQSEQDWALSRAQMGLSDGFYETQYGSGEMNSTWNTEPGCVYYTPVSAMYSSPVVEYPSPVALPEDSQVVSLYEPADLNVVQYPVQEILYSGHAILAIPSHNGIWNLHNVNLSNNCFGQPGYTAIASFEGLNDITTTEPYVVFPDENAPFEVVNPITSMTVHDVDELVNYAPLTLPGYDSSVTSTAVHGYEHDYHERNMAMHYQTRTYSERRKRPVENSPRDKGCRGKNRNISSGANSPDKPAEDFRPRKTPRSSVANMERMQNNDTVPISTRPKEKTNADYQTRPVQAIQVQPVTFVDRYCKLCKSNRETPKFYQTHSLMDSRGNVTCPVLRVHVCPICEATGDNAHTAKYCPDRRKEEDGQRYFTTRTSSGGYTVAKF